MKMKATTKVIALCAAVCGLQVFGATVLDQSFVGLSALPSTWSIGSGHESSGISCGANGAVTASSWKQDRLYTSVDIHRGAKYTITAVTYETQVDANAIIFLGSTDYSICIGHSYTSNPNIVVGSIAGDASQQFVSYQTNTGTNPGSQVTVATKDTDLTIGGNLTYTLVLEGTSLSATVSDGTKTATNTFTLPADTTFTTIGAQIDCDSGKVGIQSVKVENNDAVATLTTTDDAAWSTIWDSGSSEPLAGTNAVIHVNADKTVKTAAGWPKNFKTLVLTSEAEEDKNLTLNLGDAMTVEKLVIDAPLTLKDKIITATTVEASEPLTIEATSTWTADDALKNLMKNSVIPQVILKGTGTAGVTADYSDMGGKTFSNHWVVASGTHTLKITNGDKNYNIADKTTAENPWILVQNGATLNLQGKDLGGWQGDSYKATNCVIRVNDGGTLNMGLYSSDTTCYYQGRFYLDAGSTMSIGNAGLNNFRINGGMTAGCEQIYMPDQESTSAKHATINGEGRLTVGSDSTAGFAFYVGNNATLDVSTQFDEHGGNSTAIAKNGAGTLNITGDLTYMIGAINLNAGTLGLGSTPHGAIKAASGTRLTANADLNITTAVALNDAKVSVAEGKTLKLTNVTSNGGIREINLAANATNELTVADGVVIQVGSLTGSSTLVKKGAGTLVLTSANSNFSGKVKVEEGSLICKSSSGLGSGSAEFATAASLTVEASADEVTAGSISINNISGVSSVTVVTPDNRVFTAPVSEGTATVTLTAATAVQGSNCLLDYTFYKGTLYKRLATSNIVSTGSDTGALAYDTNYSAANSYNTDNGALLVKATPYKTQTWPDNYTVAVYANVPDYEKGCLMAFGQSVAYGGGDRNYIAIVRGSSANEILLVKGTGYTNPCETIAKMAADNATTAKHLVAFTKNGDVFTVYCDGTRIVSKTIENFSLGSGFQIGSIHGGVSASTTVGSGTTIIRVNQLEASVANAVEVGAVRVFNTVITDAQMELLTTEFPYVSKGGLFTRTIAADSELSSDNAWLKDGTSDYYKLPEGVTEEEVTYKPSATITTTKDATLTLNESLSLDRLTLGGDGKLTIAANEGKTLDTTGAVTVNGTIQYTYGDVNISRSPLKLGTAGKIIIDLTGMDTTPLMVYKTTEVIQLTGTTDEKEDGVSVINPPTLPYRKLEVVFDDGNYWLKVTPNHEEDATLLYDSTGDASGDMAGKLRVQGDTDTVTCAFPGDTIVFGSGSYGKPSWVFSNLVGSTFEIASDCTFSHAANQTVEAGKLFDNKTLKVDDSVTLTLACSWRNVTLGTVATTGSGTIAFTANKDNHPYYDPTADAITGTATVTVDSGITLTVSGSCNTPVKLALNAKAVFSSTHSNVTTSETGYEVTYAELDSKYTYTPTPKSYTITYELVGAPEGTDAPEGTTYDITSGTVKLTDVPALDNYTVTGWYTDQACTSEKVTEFTVATDVEPTAKTFYAKYVLNLVAVTVPTVANAEVSVTTNGAAVAIKDGKYYVIPGCDVKVTYTAAEGYLPATTEITLTNVTTVTTVPSEKLPTITLGAAKISTTAYATLEAAMSAAMAAETEQTVTLLQDVTVTSTIANTKSITLDLNGNSILASGVRAIHQQEGTLTLTGSGTISDENIANDASSIIRVGDNNGTAAGIVVGSGVTVSSTCCYAITYFGKDTQTVTVNGAVSSSKAAALSGNGTKGFGATTVTINDGAVITSTAECAIYHPETGTLTINGGTIAGLTGIEMRAGTLEMVGGTVQATYAPPENIANGNGSTTKGAAIAVAQHTTKLDIAVRITGGTLTAKENGAAVYVANPQKNATTNVSVTLGSGATYNGPLSVTNDFNIDGNSITATATLTAPDGCEWKDGKLVVINSGSDTPIENKEVDTTTTLTNTVEAIASRGGNPTGTYSVGGETHTCVAVTNELTTTTVGVMADCTVATFLDLSQLAVNDELHVYTGSDYASWKVIADATTGEKSWEPMAVVSGENELAAGQPTSTKLTAGQAAILVKAKTSKAVQIFKGEIGSVSVSAKKGTSLNCLPSLTAKKVMEVAATLNDSDVGSGVRMFVQDASGHTQYARKEVTSGDATTKVWVKRVKKGGTDEKPLYGDGDVTDDTIPVGTGVWIQNDNSEEVTIK